MEDVSGNGKMSFADYMVVFKNRDISTSYTGTTLTLCVGQLRVQLRFGYIGCRDQRGSFVSDVIAGHANDPCVACGMTLRVSCNGAHSGRASIANKVHCNIVHRRGENVDEFCSCSINECLARLLILSEIQFPYHMVEIRSFPRIVIVADALWRSSSDSTVYLLFVGNMTR